MGHAHLGGKTVLYLIDGLYSGKHPIDPAPRKMALAALQRPLDLAACWPRRTRWPSIRWASISSGPSATTTRADAAWTTTCTRRPWPTIRRRARSTTRTTPAPTKRLASLGVHEHWNNPREKKYSRNLGTGKGIELVAVESGKVSTVQ